MALSEERIHRGRPTPFPWERQALDFIYAHPSLSDTDPHQAWELHELYDPSSGRLYEIDLLFLSRQCLYLIEIKSHPGVLTGDIVDWTITEGERRRTIDCPYPGVNLKAKVLGDRLRRLLGDERPFVRAAVFLPNVTEVRLEGGRPPWLLLPDDVGEKLVNGWDERAAKHHVATSTMQKLLEAAHQIGLRPSATSREVGGYRLGELLDEGEGYQEHLAQNTTVEHDQVRVRSYLVSAAISAERRAQLNRAAEREGLALARIGAHPGILGYRSFVDDGPLGPAVLFEAFEGSRQLHDFLRHEPKLTVDERLGLLQQIVKAVAHCHQAGVLHRNLSPGSVLVRRGADGRIQVRLHRFHAATWTEPSGGETRPFQDGAPEVERLYHAPEVLADPARAALESDVFSVGCLTWLILTGEHPANSLEERERRLQGEGGLRPAGARPDLAILDDSFVFATDPNPLNRAHDVADWFNSFLLEAYTRLAKQPGAATDSREGGVAARPGPSSDGRDDRSRRRWRAPMLLAIAVPIAILASVFLLRAAAPAGASCDEPLDWKRASAHIGEAKSVAGTLVSVRPSEGVRGNPIFLEVGAAFPAKQRLSLIVWGSNRHHFSVDELDRLIGKKICVSGVIGSYRDVPQIELKSPEQIQASQALRPRGL